MEFKDLIYNVKNSKNKPSYTIGFRVNNNVVLLVGWAKNNRNEEKFDSVKGSEIVKKRLDRLERELDTLSCKTNCQYGKYTIIRDKCIQHPRIPFVVEKHIEKDIDRALTYYKQFEGRTPTVISY